MSKILIACFFLSGFSSLVYETLWTRTLTHVIGGSPYAVSIILTVFMGGLGLGGWLGGRLADRLRTPGKLLLAYGILEGIIGLYAMALSGILVLARPIFAALYAGLYQHAFAYHLVVFSLCGVLLLIPILCMGATLPLLGRYQVKNLARMGASLGFLYGLNTLGAAAGVFAAGFWLFPALGLRSTTWLAAAINAAVGAYCVWAGYRARAEAETAAPARRPAKAAAAVVTNQTARWALAAFGVSGFCAMAYEVIWTKVLGLIMGPTTYALSSVLVTFITGLALGGWAFARISDRVRNPGLLLAATQGAAALLALAASQRMGNSLFLFEKIDYMFYQDFAWSLGLKAMFLAALMLLPTLCLGGAFPLVMRLFARGGDKLGQSIGTAYAVNTLGGVLGAWGAGFLLVPWLGSERSLGLLAGVQAVSALALYFALARPRRAPELAKWLAAAAAVTWLCVTFPRWQREELSRASSRPLTEEHGQVSWWDAWWSRPEAAPDLMRKQQVFYGDGIGGFTSVWKTSDPMGQEEYSLYISGKADASSQGDMFTQVLLAHVPMLLHARPRSVMVLGLASGVTAGETLHYPLDRVDILEINPQVVRATDFFRPWNNGVLENPKADLILQDAKAHLLLSGRGYDVIISEPSNPWMAGLAELFSREFLKRARAGLGEGGVMVQFLHSYQMDWETFALIGRTFAEVFPNSMLVRTMPDDRPENGNSSDYLLVGRKGGAPLNFENNAEKLAALARSRNIVLPDVRLFSRLVVAENLAELFGPGPAHTDDKPVLEFTAPRLRFTFNSKAIEAQIAGRRSLREETRAQADSLKRTFAGQSQFAAFAFSIFKPFPSMVDLPRAAPEEKRGYLESVQSYCTANFLIDMEFLNDPEMKTFCSAVQMAALNKKLKAGLPGGEIYLAMAQICMQNNVPQNAINYYRKAVESAGEATQLGRVARQQMEQALQEMRSESAP